MRDYGQEEAARRNNGSPSSACAAPARHTGPQAGGRTRLPLVELRDAEIERETGMPMGEIFALYGQSGYRRIEQRCLRRALDSGGTYGASPRAAESSADRDHDLLLSRCLTIWLRTSPEEHAAASARRATCVRWPVARKRWKTCAASSPRAWNRAVPARRPRGRYPGQGGDESSCGRAAVEDRGR